MIDQEKNGFFNTKRVLLQKYLVILHLLVEFAAYILQLHFLKSS